MTEQTALTSAIQEGHRIGASDIWVPDGGPILFRTGSSGMDMVPAEMDGAAVIYEILSSMDLELKNALYRSHPQDLRGGVEPEDKLGPLRYRMMIRMDRHSQSLRAVIRILPREIPFGPVPKPPAALELDSPVGSNPGLDIDQLITGKLREAEGEEGLSSFAALARRIFNEEPIGYWIPGRGVISKEEFERESKERG